MSNVDQKMLKLYLKKMLTLPGNNRCANCGKQNPKWADAKLGIFICLECSGCHRRLGTHICFVRSTQMDKWKPEQVEFMRTHGNERANNFFMANFNNGEKVINETTGMSQRLEFIKNKYQFKKWAVKPGQLIKKQEVKQKMDSVKNTEKNKNTAPERVDKIVEVDEEKQVVETTRRVSDNNLNDKSEVPAKRGRRRVRGRGKGRRRVRGKGKGSRGKLRYRKKRPVKEVEEIEGKKQKYKEGEYDDIESPKSALPLGLNKKKMVEKKKLHRRSLSLGDDSKILNLFDVFPGVKKDAIEQSKDEYKVDRKFLSYESELKSVKSESCVDEKVVENAWSDWKFKM